MPKRYTSLLVKGNHFAGYGKPVKEPTRCIKKNEREVLGHKYATYHENSQDYSEKEVSEIVQKEESRSSSGQVKAK